MLAELDSLMPPDPETLSAGARLAMAQALPSNDNVESGFGSVGNSIKRSPGKIVHTHTHTHRERERESELAEWSEPLELVL
jgi:hypothetical protein